MASEYAVALKKRDEDNPFSLKWFHKFMGRWPTLEVKKPRSLSVARVKATSQGIVSKYFSDLDKILTKYHLKDTPHHIYNVDEKGLQQSIHLHMLWDPKRVMHQQLQPLDLH